MTTSEKKKKNINTEEDPNEIKGIHQFIMGEKLGQGTFGKVRLATHIVTGEKVAIKILEKDKIYKPEDKTMVENEIRILKMIRHNNLVQVYQVIQTNKLIYIVMEYSQGKDLFNYIVSNKKIKEDEACHYFQQIIDGVDYCHKLKICHRDLKPENLLLEGRQLKLIDFGLSNTWGKSGKLSTACGSPSYAAPEMILGESDYYGSRVDIWSCGVILYVMVCGFLPFEDNNVDKLYKKIIEGKYALPSFVSEPCKDLIRKIMNADQEKRYTISEIKMHPWYKSITPKINEGLLPTQLILPTDEEIMDDLIKRGFRIDEVRESIILNKNNHLTTSYYLLVKSKIRQGLQSESDLFSERYVNYIRNPDNQLSRYDYDLKKALEARMQDAKKYYEEREKMEKDRKNLPDYSSFNFISSNNTSVNKENEEVRQEISSALIDNISKETYGNEATIENPYEVNIDIKNDFKKSILNNKKITNDGKNIFFQNKLNINSNSVTSRINYEKRLNEKRKKKFQKERPLNKNTTFDCRNTYTIQEETNKLMENCEELKERINLMKENYKYGIKFNYTNKMNKTDEVKSKKIKDVPKINKSMDFGSLDFSNSGPKYNLSIDDTMKEIR